MKRFLRREKLHHLMPLFSVFIAVGVLFLAPFFAYQTYRTPFLGAFFEHNQVVSQIDGDEWAARGAGVAWSDRLIAIEGVEVGSAAQQFTLLSQTGFVPLEVAFETREGKPFTIEITPTSFALGDLFTFFIIPYLVGCIFLAAGLWAYKIRPDLRASRAFVTFAASLSVITAAFFDMNTTHNLTLLWTLSLAVGSGALINLALVFPQEMPFITRYGWTRQISLVPVFLVGIPAGREILFPATPYTYIDKWIISYGLMAFSIAFFAFMLIVRMLRSHLAIVRQQSRIIVFGASLAFFPAFFFYLIPIALTNSIPEFRPSLYFAPLIFLPISVTYAIIRYRLLDVDQVLSRALTYLLTTAVAFGIFYGLISLISALVQQTVAPNDPLIIASYLLLLMLALNPLHNFIQRAINRVFYRSPADYRRALTNISNKLAVTPDLSRTLDILEKELNNALAPERFVIYLYHDEQSEYLPHASQEDSAPPYTIEDPLIGLIRDAAAPIWLPPNGIFPETIQSDAYAYLAGYTFVPLRYEGKLIGFFSLGRRRSGALYSGDDLDFLGAVASQSTLALENARLFSNLERTLNQTMEMKNLMDDIFASIATGVITTDLEYKITLFNNAAQDILGIPLEDVLNKPLEEAFPDFYPELESRTQTAISQGTPTMSEEISPHIRTRGDIHLRLSCAPLLDAHRSAKGTTIFFEDLTKRRELEAEQRRIHQTFGRVVAPRVRDRLLADPGNLRLDGTEQTVTILFADLSGFTAFSEHRSAEEVFKLLNLYLDLAAQAILVEEGTLDKFMGDAVMGIWNSPDLQEDHALRAVRAAHTISKEMIAMHKKLPDPSHHLVFRIGVATGTAMIGNVGTNELFNYTAIGDTVNTANRLQTAAKSGEIFINKAAYELVAAYVLADELEPLKVKGREEKVTVYNVREIL